MTTLSQASLSLQGTASENPIYRWASEIPKAPLGAGLSSFGATLWYGLSYAGPSSAPWQGVLGGLGAGLIAAPFKAYENYMLYREGKRSLSHSILDGVSETISIGIASYIGSAVSSLIISSAAVGAVVPLGVILGAALVSGILGAGTWYGLSAIKEGIFKEARIS